MRIGIDARFLTHPQPGGFKTYTFNLLEALGQIDSGDEYYVYLDRYPTCDVAIPHKDKFRYRVIDGTARVVGMPIREQVGLRRQIARDALDLVHFPCNSATVGLSGRYVVTLHDTIQLTTRNLTGYRAADLKRWAIATYSRRSILWAARRADRIITVSNHVKGEISRTLDIPLGRISVTYQAPNPIFRMVDLRHRQDCLLSIESRFGVRGRFILGVGYEERKNIPLLIQAFALIASDLGDLSLVVVAAEEHRRAMFKSLANALGLGNRVLVLGAISLSDLVCLYNLAELFVFPSEREGYGLPPLEAMACGLPTIAMNASSVPEIVQDGALLLDGKEVCTWANTIREVVISANMRAELKERGLRRAAQLSWNRCADETLAVYHEIAQRIDISEQIAAGCGEGQ